MNSIANDILLAATATLDEAGAMMRWLYPVLAEWPRSSWNAWLVDATVNGAPRVALIGFDGRHQEWRDIDAGELGLDTDHCQIFAGRTGIVLLAPHGVVREAEHAIYGIASDTLRIRPETPAVIPYREFFASFGVSATH
jgi:hypothetical protein